MFDHTVTADDFWAVVWNVGMRLNLYTVGMRLSHDDGLLLVVVVAFCVSGVGWKWQCDEQESHAGS